MAPSAPTLALAFAFGIGGRSADSFHVGNSAACSRRRPRPATATAVVANAKAPTIGLAAQGKGSKRNGSGRCGCVLGQTAGDTEGGTKDAEADADANAEAEAKAEALRRQVFSNEKGFLESSAFNPARARAEREEEEARAFAARWGGTPERAKEVLERTKEDTDLSFQELEGIAQELNMSDEKQRAFMLEASMKLLSAATTPPRRTPPSRVKKAVDERVFASEKGFLKNSAAFKSRLKVGSGVRFDSQGFPVAGEDDPVIQAAKKTAKAAEEVSGVEGVVFPSLPDCPCCSTPTTEDELSQFGMCSQCKGLEVSSKAYSGPAKASKYTYDNGDAPFSESWRLNSKAKAAAPVAARDSPPKPKPTRGGPSSPPVSSSSFAPPPAPASSGRNETIPRPPLRKGNGTTASGTGGGGGGGGGGSGGGGGRGPSHAAAAAVAAHTKAAPVGAAAAATTPPAASAATATDATSGSDAYRVGDRAKFSGSARGGSSAQTHAPAERAASSAARGKGKGDAKSTASRMAGRDPAPAGGGSSGDLGLRRLALEVAELRTLLGINRAALARVAAMGGQTAAAATTTAAAATVTPAAAGVVKDDARNRDDERRRDLALRKLNRDVAELRGELSVVGDKVSDAVETPPRGGSRGGESEVVLTMKREMAELRSQLDNSRKETALTRSALRRLQGDVDALRKAVVAKQR